jgi:ubiquinone biosynthesis protein COQ4
MSNHTQRARRALHILRTGSRTLVTRDFGADLAAVQDGLDLTAFEGLGRRLEQSATGRRLLAERPRIDLASVDVDAMRTLPPDTLGHQVLDHLERNALLADIELPTCPFDLSPAAAYAKRRWRETHDIRHVLTGLGISIRDEIVLQAFQLGQFHNRFALVQMTVGPLLSPMAPGPLLRDYRRAYQAGRAARSLIDIPWERYWDRRVDELRVVLGVRPLA